MGDGNKGFLCNFMGGGGRLFGWQKEKKKKIVSQFLGTIIVKKKIPQGKVPKKNWAGDKKNFGDRAVFCINIFSPITPPKKTLKKSHLIKLVFKSKKKNKGGAKGGPPQPWMGCPP